MRRPSPTELSIDVELQRPGVLVVSETAYPGWVATVDGKRQRWFRANYVLRGLELDAGRHQVRFVYRSRALRTGSWLSAAGGVILAGCALAAVPSVRRRFSRSSTSK